MVSRDGDHEAAESRKFYAVCGWEDIQNPKRPKYPPWTRLYRSLLDEPRMHKLTMAQRGFYLAMHMLAAMTGNRIPFDIKWIANRVNYPRQHAGIAIACLIRLDLVSVIVVDADPKENRHLVGITGTRSVPRGRGEGEGEGEKNLNSTGSGTSELSTAHNNGAEQTDIFQPPPDPSPPRIRRKGSQDFEVINNLVLAAASKFRTRDPHRVIKYCPQVTLKQCEASIRQLGDRGLLNDIDEGVTARAASHEAQT